MRYAVVMAGGAGTRLWPAARRHMPKQLQRLIFDEPLITETVKRLSAVYEMERILIVTAGRYAQSICDAVPGLPRKNIISEPFGRNTAAAIALAAFRIVRQDPAAVFAVFPADHVVLKPEALFAALEFAEKLAQEHRVVDIGVPPSHPETGYGYIEMGDEIGERNGQRAYAVKRFVEKPDAEQAREYLEAGNYIWNSGMFVWRANEYLDALREYLPDTYARLSSALDTGDAADLEEAYEEIQDISVDYAVMEREPDVVAVPVDFGWRDIGDWAALYEMMQKDSDGNAYEGSHITLDTEGCLLLARDKVIATIGLRDIVVVDAGDVVLIMPRERAQEVKGLLERVKEEGMDELL
jgi:mannose-1-phosphate guanylyltransferase